MKDFKEIDSMFEGLEKHKISSKRLIRTPGRDADGALIEAQILMTLDDGMEVDLCLWSTEGMSFWDISIDKEKSGIVGNNAFLAYLLDKGLPLCNIKDKNGKWQYCGLTEREKEYRVQYLEIDDDL